MKPLEPFLETEGAASQADRRLILVSYHFPPDRAVGARRWEKFSHFAAARGWGLDVFMCGDPASMDAEPARRVLPGGVRVFVVPSRTLMAERIENAIWSALKGRSRAATQRSAESHAAAVGAPDTRPASLSRADLRWDLHTPRGWMRAYWAALDFARIGSWGGAVFEAVAKIFDPGVHRAVITSGPPFMSHEAGRNISRRFGIPFVMDMRDPWSHVERLAESVATPVWTWLASHYEGRAVSRAVLIVANTDVARRQMATSYPLRARDVITVTNGADDDPLPPPRRGGRFVIAHAGTLYLDRDPRGLFQAAARVIREMALTPDDLTLEFIGELEAVGGFPIEEVARAEGISEYVRTGPSRPYRDAVAFMAHATMLITMSGSNMAAIPAKTFECVRFPAWILALSAPESASALLLQDTGADIASPGDVAGIAEIIGRRFREHRDGVLPEPVGQDPRFTRGYQAELLLNAIEARVRGN